MDRSLFSKTKYVLTQLPEWNCPSCRSGALRRVQEEEFRILRTAATQAMVDEPYFDHEHDHGVFSGRLLCGNCLENVFVSGLSTTGIDFDPETGTDYFVIIEPRFFIPAPPLIEVDARVPKRIAELVDTAATVFWSSHEACINRLRCVTEEILNFLGIKARTESGAYISLHDRVEKIEDAHKTVRDALMAAKHMGNDASHGSFLATREEVLDAFEVLEYCIAELFPVDRSGVLSIISRVNNQKGFRPKG